MLLYIKRNYGDLMNNFKCNLCPRKCNVDRETVLGYCQAPNKLVIGKYYLHKWEEPCITGEHGSGTIFFSYCNLKCIFCQNYQISTLNVGKEITIEKFSDICLKLQGMHANNINLVSPTHYVHLIKEGLILARKKGLTIPIVYNTSSYELASTIDMLNGLVDIYLPDLKYYDDNLAKKYSNAPNYFKYATKAIEAMYNQVGPCQFDQEGNIIKGVIVRHLILPNHSEDSKIILKYLYSTYKDNIYISIMNQYTPLRKLSYDNLNRKLTPSEYDEIIDYAWDLGIRNAFTQEEGTQSDSFVPDFNCEDI